MLNLKEGLFNRCIHIQCFKSLSYDGCIQNNYIKTVYCNRRYGHTLQRLNKMLGLTILPTDDYNLSLTLGSYILLSLVVFCLSLLYYGNFVQNLKKIIS